MNREINNLLRKVKEQSRAAAELEAQGDKENAAAMREAARQTQHQADELRRELYGNNVN